VKRVRPPKRPAWNTPALAGVVAASLLSPTLACTSSSELEQIRLQLADIQRQLLQLQTETPDRAAVESLGAAVRSDLERIARGHADVGLEVRQLAARIDALEAKITDAQGGFAELSAQIATAQEELESFLGQAMAQRGEGGPPAAGTGALLPSDPQDLYQSAYNDFLRGNYDLAILGFRQFLASFGGSQLADNSQYWIGECYFHQQKFREAIAEFDRVSTGYPTSERIASALLRKGYAWLELGDSAAGREALQMVVNRFPRSDEAILAQRQLDTLGRGN
jgi:tol-pal system protein YbgF